MSNLRAHIKSKHPLTHQKLEEAEKPSPATTKQQTLSTFCNVITVPVSRIEVVKGLLYFVTLDGRPFELLEDEGMSVAFRPILKRLNIKYNRHNISELIKLAAEYIVEKLKKMLRTSLASVKVDGVSRFSRAFMGINVQVN